MTVLPTNVKFNVIFVGAGTSVTKRNYNKTTVNMRNELKKTVRFCNKLSKPVLALISIITESESFSSPVEHLKIPGTSLNVKPCLGSYRATLGSTLNHLS